MINNKLKTYLYNYFRSIGMRDYRRNWMKGDCPYCGKNDKFGINLAINRSNCFVCGGKLRPFYLVMDLEEFTSKADTFKFLGNYQGLDYYEKSVVREIENKPPLKLPEGFRLLNTGKSQMGKSARNYIKSRGFDPDEMSLKGWGYCVKGKYKGYIIIPVYFKGELVYFTSRRFIGNGPKFFNISLDETDRGKNLVIYNHEALFMYDKIRIVESIMNAETLGDNAIAINGKTLSSYQLTQLIKSEATHFTVLLDHDAWIHSIYLCLKLAPYKWVKPIYFEDDRDVNDLGKKQTLKKIFKNRYLTYNECLKLKHDYERSILTYN